MRFSDIQENPLNYNTNQLIEKLKNHFTISINNCPFINQLPTNRITVQLADATLQPNILVYIVTENGFKKAYVAEQQIRTLYNATIWNESESLNTIKPAFSKDFLQNVMCNTISNEYFKRMVQNTIASIALENITEYSSQELNEMFGPYLEDKLETFELSPELNSHYNFISTTRIEVKPRPHSDHDEFELIKPDNTHKWMLNKELPPTSLEKFKEDIQQIKNCILEQSTELNIVLNKSLPQELTPYLNRISHINVTMYTREYGPKWIIDNDYSCYSYIEHKDYYYQGKSYKLEIPVPLKLTYDSENQTTKITLPIKTGESLKPAENAINLFEESYYAWNKIKEQLKKLYIKELIEQTIEPKRDIINELLFSSNNKTICFEENNIEYKLKIEPDKATYRRNYNTQIIFVKKEKDFKISLEYSDLKHTPIPDLENTINDLIDKF